jgi:hypothetical protein
MAWHGMLNPDNSWLADSRALSISVRFLVQNSPTSSTKPTRKTRSPLCTRWTTLTPIRMGTLQGSATFTVGPLLSGPEPRSPVARPTRRSGEFGQERRKDPQWTDSNSISGAHS